MDIKDIFISPITPANLFRMETYTDQLAGTIFRQIPVLENGERDPMRMESFGGSCTILVNNRPLPITFTIEGTCLGEAIENFAESVRACLQAMYDEGMKKKILTAEGKPFAVKPNNKSPFKQ